MRTIKFRAKPCYMGGNQPAWVYGTFQYIAQRRVRPGATDNGTLEPRNDKGRIVDLYGTETEVLCDTVGQFTGLKDKNGKEIYEGDVVQDYEGVVHYVRWSVGDGCFDFTGSPYALSDDCEVIGNIHDNPEMIKRKNE